MAGERAACIEALLAHKCDADARASGKSRFRHTHNADAFSYTDSTPLMFAARNGRVVRRSPPRRPPPTTLRRRLDNCHVRRRRACGR